MQLMSYFFSASFWYVFFDTRPKFSNWSVSASIWSREDFRTTAPTYFLIGNPFPIDLRVFGHHINRLDDPNVVKVKRKFAVTQCKSKENQ